MLCNTTVARNFRAKVTKSHLVDSWVIQREKKTLYSCFGKVICEINFCDGGRNVLNPSVLKGACDPCNALSALVLLGLSWHG